MDWAKNLKDVSDRLEQAKPAVEAMFENALAGLNEAKKEVTNPDERAQIDAAIVDVYANMNLYKEKLCQLQSKIGK